MTETETSPQTSGNQPGVRDVLALDRTILANERTVLAYVRTALTLFVAGVSFVKFFDSWAIETLGWAFVPLGALVLAVGVWRYRKMHVYVRDHGNGGCGPRQRGHAGPVESRMPNER